MGSDSGARRLRAFRSVTGNRALLRVVAGYALFTLTEYSVWIAMLVFAYSRGGATVAGLVALAQLVPAAVLAPVVAAAADRRSPVVLLAGGYLVQAAGMAATAVAVIASAPIAAYAAATVAAAAVTTTRPAQAALIPSVSVTPDQLTAANVVVGWVEAAGITTAGLLVGALISVGGVASVFAVCAALGVVAALLVARLRVPAPVSPPEGAQGVQPGLGECLELTVRRPRLRLMLALLTAEAAVVGALDLLFVILAVSVLGRSQAWAGYLNGVYGVGAVLAATVSALLVGRRLGVPILGAALLLSGALTALAFGVGVVGTVALLTVAGAGRALLDVASRTLLQRSVPRNCWAGSSASWKGSPCLGWLWAHYWCRCWCTWAAIGSRCSGSQPCCRWPPQPAAARCSAWTPTPPCRSCRSRFCARSRCSPNCLPLRSRALRRPSHRLRCQPAPC